MATKFVGENLSCVKWVPLSNSVLDKASLCITGIKQFHIMLYNYYSMYICASYITCILSKLLHNP